MLGKKEKYSISMKDYTKEPDNNTEESNSDTKGIDKDNEESNYGEMKYHRHAYEKWDTDTTEESDTDSTEESDTDKGESDNENVSEHDIKLAVIKGITSFITLLVTLALLMSFFKVLPELLSRIS